MSKDYLDTLDEVNFGELHENKNKWSDIRFGDKNKLETTNLVRMGDTTSVNHFTHVHSGKAFPDFKFRKTLTPGDRGISN